MDWQERLRRNREQIAKEGSPFGGISRSLDAGGFSSAVQQPKAAPPEDPGFLGSVLQNAGKVVGGIYDFGKGIVDNVANGINDTGELISATGASLINQGQSTHNREIINQRNKEFSTRFGSGTPQDWSNPEFERQAKEFANETMRLANENGKDTSQVTERLNAIDPARAAASAADTFLNVATLGVGGILKNAAKGAVVGGAKAIGKDVVKHAVTAPLTSGQAWGKLGHMAFEGGTIGAAQGGLDPVRRNGSNVDWKDIATNSLIGGALGGVLSPALGGILDGNIRRAVPGMARDARFATNEGARNAAASIGRATSGYAPGHAAAGMFDPLNIGRKAGGFADDVNVAPEYAATPFDAGFSADVKTPSSSVSSEAADTINLNRMSAVRREKIVQQLNGKQEISLDAFNTAEKKIIRSHLDNVIAQENPEIGNHIQNPFDESAYNTAAGDVGIPKMTKNEIINHFGSMDGFPIRNIVKENSGQRGIDLQAMDAGFDNVDDFLAAAKNKIKARNDAKDMDSLLRDARKDPTFIDKAIRDLVSEDTVDRTRGPYLSRTPQGYTPAKVIEARSNNAMDYSGSYPDEMPQRRMSDITTSIYGESPSPSVAPGIARTPATSPSARADFKTKFETLRDEASNISDNADYGNFDEIDPALEQSATDAADKLGVDMFYDESWDGYMLALKDSTDDMPTAARKLQEIAKDYDVNIDVNPDGTIRMYHGTNEESMKAIHSKGFEDGMTFFSPSKEVDYGGVNGAGYYGDNIIEADIDPRKVVFNPSGEFSVDGHDAASMGIVRVIDPNNPAQTAPAWSRDVSVGNQPDGRPQLQLGSGLPTVDTTPSGPVNLNRTQLKRMAKNGTTPENYTIGAKPAGANPTIVDENGLAGKASDFKDTWTMDDARAALGGEEPLLGANGKPAQFRGAPIAKSDEEALMAIMDAGNLDGSGNFKDINGMIEDITRNMEGGRLDSKSGALLDRVYNTIGHKSGDESRAMSSWNTEIGLLGKKYTFDAKESEAANQWLQAGSNRAEAEAAIRKELGDESANKIISFYDEAKPRLARFIDGYNREMVANGLPDRVIKGLDPETYFPRIYTNPSLKDKIVDTMTGGAGQLDTRHAGIANNGFDPNNMSGTTTRADMALPNNPRAAGQAPIGSADNKPNSGYNAFAQHRTANSAQGPMVNPMDALYKYGQVMTQQTNRVKAVTEIRRLEKIAKVVQEKTGDNRFTPIINAFTNSANALTGKTNVLDRGFIDTVGGQRMMRVLGTVSKSLSRSQLLGSFSTVAAQTGQLPLMVARLGPENYAKGIKLMTNTKQFAAYAEKSNFLIRNFPENHSMFSAEKVQAAVEKGVKLTGTPMQYTAELMAKTSYAGAIEQGLAKKMTGQKLIDYADSVAAAINADRVAGLRSNAYESRVLQPLVMYTQDVNQLYQSAKRFVGEKNYKAVATLMAATYAYNIGYEQITGQKMLADPVNAAMDAGRTLTDKNLVDSEGNSLGMGERITRATGRLAGEAAAGTPLGNAIVGALYPDKGIRLPFGGGERVMSRSDVFGNSQVGRFGGSMPITSAFENPLYLLGIPGASQIQKGYEGMKAYNAGASISPSGTNRFDIEQTPENLIRSLIYGPYQTAEGRAYLRDRNNRAQGYQGS